MSDCSIAEPVQASEKVNMEWADFLAHPDVLLGRPHHRLPWLWSKTVHVKQRMGEAGEIVRLRVDYVAPSAVVQRLPDGTFSW